MILSTNVAETSLTIEGISAVVDGGMHRVVRFDAERGLPVLCLSAFRSGMRSSVPVAPAAPLPVGVYAVGRVDQQRLSQSPAAEIAAADLAPLCLDLRSIHGDDLRSFRYQAPEAAQLAAAEELLTLLGLIEAPSARCRARANTSAVCRCTHV